MGIRLVVVWCGVVWCGVVWCGVVWCGVVWCGPSLLGRHPLPVQWDAVWFASAVCHQSLPGEELECDCYIDLSNACLLQYVGAALCCLARMISSLSVQ